MSCCIARKWIIFLLGIYSSALIFCQRAGMSVAMIRMIKPSSINVNSTNTTIIKSNVPQFEWSQTLQGIILSASFYLYWIVPTIVGSFVERVGGKWLAFTGVFVPAILTAITPWATTNGALSLIILQIIIGAAQGFSYPSLFHLYVQWFPPEERCKANSSIQTGVSLGCAFIYSLGGYLSETKIGWPMIFYVSSAIHVPWLLLWIYFVKDKPPIMEIDEKRNFENKQTINEEPRLKKSTPWLAIIKSPVVWSSGISKFAGCYGYFMLMSKLPSYLNSIHGMKIINNGFVNSATSIGYGVSGFMAPYISKYLIDKLSIPKMFTRKIFQSIAMLTPALCLISITLLNNNHSIIIALLVIALIGFGFMTAGEWTMVSEFAPNFVGAVSGFTLMIGFFSGILAPYIVGLILDSNIGTLEFKWNLAFYVNVAVYVFGLVSFYIFSTDQQQEWDKL